MEIINVGQFHSELVAAGLSISGADSNGNVHLLQQTEDADAIIDAVRNVQGKSLSSDEGLALQALLTESQWLAVQDARKAPVRSQREARYRTEADPMRLKMDEDFTPGSEEWELARQNWILFKNQIREDLSYSE